jgi:hypothetical protein
VRSGERDFTIWADIFGWVCRACGRTELRSVRRGKRLFKGQLLSDDSGLAGSDSNRGRAFARRLARIVHELRLVGRDAG